MADETPPIGQRFSQAYLERGQPGLDSARFRNRVAGFFTSQIATSSSYSGRFATMVRVELGVDVPYSITYLWTDFFATIELRDVLDFITIVHHAVAAPVAQGWLTFVQRVFDEENLSYRVDDKGGVRYRPDREFARARSGAIEAIGTRRYSAVRREFEASYAALDQASPDGKRAIDAMFEAIEIVFKLACGDANAPRLGKQEASRYLRPIIDRLYASDSTVQRSANQMVSSLGEWADAAHWYRHGQKTQEPAQPPLDHAILMVGAGANYIRWLASLDALNQMLE